MLQLPWMAFNYTSDVIISVMILLRIRTCNYSSLSHFHGLNRIIMIKCQAICNNQKLVQTTHIFRTLVSFQVDDIHRAYEAAFEYIREMKSESLHKLLSGLITGLRRAAITTEGEARQQMKTKSTTSLQVQDPPSRFSQPQSTGAAASDELPRKQPSCPSSPESQGAAITSSRMVSVRVPHCSHAQCTKCAGHTSCRHCACTSCRRERYRHRYRREAEVMPNPQHGRPSKEDGESKSHEQPLPNTEPRKKLKTRHSLVSCTRGTEAQPASPEGPADQSRGDLVRSRRPASREEIQYMAKQVATAVLKDKQQRSQSPPQMAQEVGSQLAIGSKDPGS